MPKRRIKRKRSKALVLMLLPALIFVGIMGWLIYSLEPPNRKAKKVNHEAIKAKSEDDGVTFMPAVYEEHTEIRTR